MSLLKVNTGNYNDLFNDLVTALGTTLAWTLFDDISADEKVYTIPVTTGGFSPVAHPSFIRVFRDNTAFSVRLTVYDGWSAPGGPGTNPVPATDANTKNILDFGSGTQTIAYRIYGDASEGYICLIHDGTVLFQTMGCWIGVLQGRDTPASHPNPNACLHKISIGANPACDFLNNGLSVKAETDATFFSFAGWLNSTEPHSGKAPIVTGFAWFGQANQTGEIAGAAADLFQCSGNLAWGDTITIGADVYRVWAGGSYCIKE